MHGAERETRGLFKLKPQGFAFRLLGSLLSEPSEPSAFLYSQKKTRDKGQSYVHVNVQVPSVEPVQTLQLVKTALRRLLAYSWLEVSDLVSPFVPEIF